MPWPQVEATLRTELGTGVDEAFATFDREPLAAVSIAQLHRATLPDGQPVVVKVCRPGVRAVVDRDLDIVLRLADRCSAAPAGAGPWLVVVFRPDRGWPSGRPVSR